MAWPYSNPYMSQFQYPYQNQMPYPQQTQPAAVGPQMQVVRVNGRGGAETFAIGPNSSALLLDESGKLVWAVTTDGAGYKTISPYDIIPHQDAPAPDYSGLESRVSRLEDFVNEYTGDTSTTKRHDDSSSGTANKTNAERRS